MRPINWPARLAVILATAVAAAVGAASLPDEPYQRWQLVGGTLYNNALWSYERIHFDPRPVDVAIVGPSRGLIGLSAPIIAERLAARGKPATVANMSVIEDGRNIEWAVVDELYKAKRPKVLVVVVGEAFNRWGHPGFKLVAPAAAIARPPAPLLHNSLYDLMYLPFRQLKLFAARAFPATFGLRHDFDPAAYAAMPTDFSKSQRMPDGKWIDMDSVQSAEALDAEARAFARTQRPSQVPRRFAGVVEADNPVYVTEIARTAAAHGTRLVFVMLPKFDQPRRIEGRSFYERLGPIVDNGDLSPRHELFQSFAHLNHAGAMIASERVADALVPLL